MEEPGKKNNNNGEREVVGEGKKKKNPSRFTLKKINK
jgi:hypothetical protein